MTTAADIPDWPTLEIIKLYPTCDVSEVALREALNLLGGVGGILVCTQEQASKAVIAMMWDKFRAISIQVIPKEILNNPYSWCLVRGGKAVVSDWS